MVISYKLGLGWRLAGKATIFYSIPQNQRPRKTTDFRGRRDIARHQSRRDREHIRVVVEAESRHVGRQQRGAVHVQGEEIVDDVDVFGAVQAP